MPSIFDMTSSQHRQRVCVLGSTGSVGLNTLDVIAHHPERYEVFALSAMSRVDELFAQCVQWRPRYALMPDRQAAQQLRARLHDQGLRTEVMDGAAALADIAAHPEIDVVMAAIGQREVSQGRKAGFADLLIAQLAKAAGCTHTVTFDKTAARSAGMRLLTTVSE